MGGCNSVEYEDEEVAQHKEDNWPDIYEGYEVLRAKLLKKSVVYFVTLDRKVGDNEKLKTAYLLCLQRIVSIARPGRDLIVTEDNEDTREISTFAVKNLNLEEQQFIFAQGDVDKWMKNKGNFSKHPWWKDNEWMFCPFKTSTEWTKFMDNFTATDQEPTPELFGIPDTGISSGYHLLHSEFDGSLLEESPLTFDKHLNIPFGGIVRDVKELEYLKAEFRDRRLKKATIRHISGETSYHSDLARVRTIVNFPVIIQAYVKPEANLSCEFYNDHILGRPLLEMSHRGEYSGIKPCPPILYETPVLAQCIIQTHSFLNIIPDKGFGSLHFILSKGKVYLTDIQFGLNGSIFTKLFTLLRGFETHPYTFREWKENTYTSLQQCYRSLQLKKIHIQEESGGHFPFWTDSGALWYITIGPHFVKSFTEDIDAEEPVTESEDENQESEMNLKPDVQAEVLISSLMCKPMSKIRHEKAESSGGAGYVEPTDDQDLIDDVELAKTPSFLSVLPHRERQRNLLADVSV